MVHVFLNRENVWEWHENVPSDLSCREYNWLMLLQCLSIWGHASQGLLLARDGVWQEHQDGLVSGRRGTTLTGDCGEVILALSAKDIKFGRFSWNYCSSPFWEDLSDTKLIQGEWQSKMMETTWVPNDVKLLSLINPRVPLPTDYLFKIINFFIVWIAELEFSLLAGESIVTDTITLQSHFPEETSDNILL